MISPRRGVPLFSLALLALAGGPARADLLVSSGGSNQVLHYDSAGNFVQVFASGNGLSSPQGLVFGPNGNLFVSSRNQVLEYDGKSGTFVTAFVPPDNNFMGPAGLVFGPNGDLFVSSFGNGQVRQYSGTTGAFLNVFASGSGLSAPEGLAFGPNGDLFVSSFATSQVLEYDGATGGFVRVFASGNGLAGPLGLAFGPNGDLFVSSAGNNRVLEFDGTTGAFLKVFAAGGLSRPEGLVFGPNGDLFVSSQGNNTVLQYDGVTGDLVKQFIFPGLGGLDSPTFLTFGPAGAVSPAVPEPSSLALLGLGSLAVAVWCRQRRRHATPSVVCPPAVVRKEAAMSRLPGRLLLLGLAALLGAVASPAHAGSEPGSLWYNGDGNGSNGVANGRNTASASVSNIFDNFIVPDGPGWDVTGMYSDNFTTSIEEFKSVDFSIRTGMGIGIPGTIVTFGSGPANIIPTGQTAGPLKEERFLVSGLRFHLDPGEYWVNVTPVGSGSGLSLLSTTDGLNAVGTPPGNDGRSFWFSPNLDVTSTKRQILAPNTTTSPRG